MTDKRTDLIAGQIKGCDLDFVITRGGAETTLSTEQFTLTFRHAPENAANAIKHVARMAAAKRVVIGVSVLEDSEVAATYTVNKAAEPSDD